jgi:DNA modification methylase
MEELGFENSVIHGNGSRMDLLADGQADLVFTSPPYFSDATFEVLAVPKAEQTDLKNVENDILSFARTLRPVFEEIYRVLKPGRALVVQTKDVRYGNFLIPLSDAHLSVATSCGFHLVTRVFWAPSKFAAKRLPTFLKSRKVGQFRSFDTEVFLILTKASGLENRGDIEAGSAELRELARPLWRMPFKRRKDDHPYVSPRPVVKQLVLLLTEAGDLVVDPFAGYGTILEVAKSTGRSGVGWDVDLTCVEEANRRLT